ncbi:MAG: LuxR C-terminal-related transcriptional regulator [Firmicutes bacterium]|nr:LuxR C-terminal-related transcriptional regulator [Bacillota bacterium]
MPLYESVHLNRPRINNLLRQAVQKPLVTVCAGAGYGKTQAVQAFCRESGGKINWIQLTRQDNDEVRFWEKLIHTTMFQTAPDLEAKLLSAGMPKTEAELERYTAAILSTYRSWARSGKVYTVYDDLHLVDNPDILRFIQRAEYFLKSERTVLMLSQTFPFPELIGPTARESVPLISEEDLLFTEEEVADYLHLLGVSVSTLKVRRLLEGTKGWALALSLVGQSLQKNKDFRNDVFDAMQVNINKMIQTEVQDVISDRLKNLLIRLSLLDSLPADLVHTLAAGDDGLVKELEKCSAYVRYDIFLNTYVIHKFFLQYLRQYQNTLSEEETRTVYREAGDWCARNGYIVYAVDNYEKARDYEALIRLIYFSVNRQIPPDMAVHLLAVLENAPAAAVKNPLFPRLHLRLLLSLNRLSEALKVSSAYEKRYLEQPETPETTRAIAELNYVMGITDELSSTATDRYTFYRYFLRQDLYFSKYPYLDENVWQPSLFVGFWVTCVGTERAGALEEFITALEKSSLALIHARGGYGAGKVAAARGELCFYQGKYKEADQYFQASIQEAHEQKQFDLILCDLFYRMRICFFLGDTETCERVLQSMKELLSEERYLARYTAYDVAIGFYFWHVGQPQRIPDWLKGDFVPYAHAKFIENAGNQLKAYYRFLIGDYEPLFAFMAERQKRETILFERLEMQAMEACALYLRKERDAAFAKLREAYETALPNQLVSPFSEFGKHMRTLSAAALKAEIDGVPREWLEMIHRQASTYAKRQARMAADFGARYRAETEIRLSRREQEVLTALSRGLTRAEIAGSLGLSQNTVKSIISSLYGKIGAGSLADAVRIGLERDLI